MLKGAIKIIEDFYMPQLNRNRTLRIYLPPEYSPWYSEIGGVYLPYAKTMGPLGGEGFKYMEFLATTLKTYIDNNFKTLSDRENTAISGSSMGGLISLCTALKYPKVYSKVGAFSSAMYFCEDKIKELIRTSGKKQSLKIYLDVGTNETSDHANKDFPKVYIDCNTRVYKALLTSGFSKEEIKFSLIKDGTHCEDCWRERYPDMIKWLFSSTP